MIRIHNFHTQNKLSANETFSQNNKNNENTSPKQQIIYYGLTTLLTLSVVISITALYLLF